MKWLVLLIVACSPRHWRDDPLRPVAGPIAQLAIASGTQVRILSIGQRAILATRTVELGKRVTKLIWTGAEPAVELAGAETGTIAADGLHPGEVAWPPASAPTPAPAIAAPLKVAVEADHLRCTDGVGHDATIPAVVPPTWLASEPPTFATADADGPHIYIDCRADAHLVAWLASPVGLVAIYGDRLDVVYRGAMIGTADGGELLAFAPSASATPAP